MINTGRLIGLCAGLLVLGNPATAVGSHDQAASYLQVSVDADHIGVTARNVATQDILYEIARLSDLKIVQYIPLQQAISLQFEQLPLRLALKRILAKDSYQLYQSQPTNSDELEGHSRSSTLWIFSEGSSDALTAATILESQLRTGNTRARIEAIKSLKKLGSPEAIDALSLALADEDSWIRGEAVNAFAEIGGDSSDAYLAQALKDEDAAVRATVVEALADDPGEHAVPALTLALQDPDPDVRMLAIDALEEIGGHAAYTSLALAREDPDPEIRDAISESLALLEHQQ
ncbi:MAG: HEAT repeat domain-containing protein [Proteobacteria bacterium]|nr:HEAT repeat domain-containing protein [Pseudomonadota bacterium]